MVSHGRNDVFEVDLMYIELQEAVGQEAPAPCLS